MATLAELAQNKLNGALLARIEEASKIVAAEIVYKEDTASPPYSATPSYDEAHAKRLFVAQSIINAPERNAKRMYNLVVGHNHTAPIGDILDADDASILGNIRQVIDQFADLIHAERTGT